MYIRVFLLFFIFSTANCESENYCDKSNVASIRLKRQLLCDYDRDLRPVLNHKDNVTLFVHMILKYYQYDMHDNSFTIDSWMVLQWKDEHLTWKPDEFENLENTHLSTNDIWVPDLSVYNRRNQGGDPSVTGTTTCIVSKKGQVTCVPSVSQSSICTSDLTRFPFDEHNCTIRLGSWVHSGEELDIRIANQAIAIQDLVPNAEWELMDTAAVKHPGVFKCCPNNTYPSINFSFKIRRIAGAHVASVILPSLALVVLTLCSLWIAPTNPQRFSLCYLNLVCEFLHLQYVWWMLPMNGDNIPLMLLFARDSLIISTFTIAFSFVVKYLVEKETPAPAWISKVVCVLVALKPRQIIFWNNSSFKGLGNEDDDSAAVVNRQEETSQNDWLIFGKILDRLCFVNYVIIYVCMFVQMTP